MTNCEKCKFWEAPTQPNSTKGVCRRHAPSRVSADQKALWPTTFPFDWCGEGESKDEEASPSQD